MKRALCFSTIAALLVVPLIALAGAAPPAGASSSSGHGLGLKLSRPDPARKLDAGKLGRGMPLAASADLSSDLPPIGDQGTHPSCVGWSVGYYAKSWWEKQEHPSWSLTNTRHQFSPSFIYNQINGGSDSGASIYDAMTLLEQEGDTDIAEFPYDDNVYRQPSSSEVEAAKQYRIPSDWGYFFAKGPNWGPYTPSDLSPLKSWLSSGKPLILGIPIYQGWPQYNGAGKAEYYDYTGGDWLGGHAIFIVGYDDNANPGGSSENDTKGGFLAINSWGPGWNDNGKVWLSYNFVKKYVPEAWFMEDRDSSPRISNISPASSPVGSLVSINGNNFGSHRRSAKVVFAGGAQAAVVSWGNDRIQVRVPDTAKSGNAYVYDWESEKSNGKGFTPGPAMGSSWLMAEGATWPGFDEWVLVQNPNKATAKVSVTFLTPTKTVPGPSFDVSGESRVSVHVNEYIQNDDVSTIVTSTNGVPVCTERAMYVNATDGKWGAHDSTGVPGVSNVWYLSEGATWPGFDEWVLVMNPYESPSDVRLTFQTPKGEVKGPTLTVAGQKRASVHINDYVPNADVSTKVECLTANGGIVAERSMYVNATDGKRGCHNSAGAFEASEGWGLPEGATWPGFEEWVLVQNPTDKGVEMEMIFLTPGNVIKGPTGSLGPGARISIRVNDFVPNADVSTLVFTKTEGQKIVVERSMYMNGTNGKRDAHNSVASEYGSKEWLLPEGCTFPGFDEWVLAMNPDVEKEATVQLTFMTPKGVIAGPSAKLPPASRASFHVNQYVSGDVSTRVTSDGYVVCERAMYINTSDGKAGSTDAMGIPGAFLGSSAGLLSMGQKVIDNRILSGWRSQYLTR